MLKNRIVACPRLLIKSFFIHLQHSVAVADHAVTGCFRAAGSDRYNVHE